MTGMNEYLKLIFSRLAVGRDAAGNVVRPATPQGVADEQIAAHPGESALVCFAVLIISFIITIIAQWIFEYMPIPAWGKYLLLLCIVTQWHILLSLLPPYSAQSSLSALVMGGFAYFTWPVLGVYMDRNFGTSRPWFPAVCWGLSFLILLSCFTSVFR